MYSLRYHFITITAVFMALGIGILLGGSVGQELFPKEQMALFHQLEEKYSTTRAENIQWSKKASELSTQIQQLDQALLQTGDAYVKGSLTGKKLVLLQLEKGDVKKLTHVLQNAGAQIQTWIKIKDPDIFLNTSSLPVIAQGLGISEEKNGNALFAQSAKLLANSVAGRESGAWSMFLQEKGWIEVQGQLGTCPDAIVILGGTSKNGQTRLHMFDTPFLKEIRKLNIPVIGAERSDSEYSVVQTYRNIGISTVDNWDQTSGLLSIVELLKGKNGSFGVKQTADSLFPIEKPYQKNGFMEMLKP